jgi:hypothetical protein
MVEIIPGILAGHSTLPDGAYDFVVGDVDPTYVLLVVREFMPGTQPLVGYTPVWRNPARSAGYTHGWAVPRQYVTFRRDMPEPYDYGALTLVEIGDGWNLHRNRDGDDVYLQHVTARVLVEAHLLDIPVKWQEFTRSDRLGSTFTRPDRFMEWLKGYTHEPEAVDEMVLWCADCAKPDHEDDLCFVNEGHGSVCETCSNAYYGCESCEERFRLENMRSTLHGTSVCDYCRDNHYRYCEPCDGYYSENAEHYHEEDEGGNGCCESPAMVFSLRNDGEDPLPNDTRVKVNLPAGEISEEGMGEIARLIRGYGYARDDTSYEYLLDVEERNKWGLLAVEATTELGTKWQTKEGNYTKRLSRYAYKKWGLKVPPALVSSVGNVGSAHSRGVDFNIEITRDLNQSASEFAHDDSCWWGSYYASRCRLKTNGGFGLRTFDDNGYVSGRAWVMPLKQSADAETRVLDPDSCQDPACCAPKYITTTGGLTPTFDTMGADAFVVFNGYEALSNYAPARILAHMTGMTYRKITFTCGSSNDMYVNGESGYLVAPEELADKYTDGALRLVVAQHATLYADEQAAALDAITEKEITHV